MRDTDGAWSLGPWAPDSYAQIAATRPAAQQDIDMSGPGEAIHEYPPLPPPAPSMAMPSNPSTFQRGAKWTPAPILRLNYQLTRWIILPMNEDELNELIHHAHEDRNMGAITSMKIFAQDAHVAGIGHSPLQSLGLTRWRIPGWVPLDQWSLWATTHPTDPSQMEMLRQDVPINGGVLFEH
jgi:hypothetical protein